ncbi:NOL1/NOP2/sun family putative RNA methylase [Haladaptatus litoreus]|uniref:NOL1/NOP2/sun family putative RNA methylase n=1 Tax=Haladaptatus litoreus TaxID=553468 RepID=A0A1N6Y3X1_9EURY|nr:RsmB/NOP family class I SAM-dependent RNA methyltransferase [Haladaptatus litoreus]SIR09169.1 NOL1/NOP2/sun family putative RNA methylase [Haladaptatus litoreus]
MDALERYEPIIDDFEAFRAACERPLPSVVRVNEIKATREQVTEAFDAEGVEWESRDWNENVLKIDSSPGNTWPSFHGWTHGQEEVSSISAFALDPEPGERVLDSCAAPGSKTTQLGALMDDDGLIVANDSNLGRLSALRFNTERLGVTCVAVTNQDARNFSLKPFGIEAFDSALVDVPCSCEGTIRKNPTALDDWSLDHIEGVAGVQKGILRRAIQATKEGGSVVYSTCTFAPEENEAVLDHVLKREDCRLVEYDIGLQSEPGLTEWQGDEFDESIRKAKRFYPHHNDTGGFFCAKLEVGA